MLAFTCTLSAQNNLPIDLVAVEGGHFGILVQDSISDTARTIYLQEIPDFQMAATEVSIQDFGQFCRETGRPMPPEPDWGWGDPKRPVVNVTYRDALGYCRWMSEKYGLEVTLPTRYQWEYAAREGHFDSPDPSMGDPLPEASIIYGNNSKDKPECITCMQPNALGIYGLRGNVWEWVLMEEKTNGKAMVMGGSFFEDASQVGADSKRTYNPDQRRQDLGFRVVINGK